MKESVHLLEAKYTEQLAHVRNIAGWKVAADGEDIWLRGPIGHGDEQLAIKGLPIKESFFLNAEGRLFPVGRQTPVGLLKTLTWQTIRELLPIKMPVAALPGETTEKVQVALVRTEQVREVYALSTDFERWKAFVETAPLIRLQQLRFALSAAGRVLITGKPLPAIKGQNYWKTNNMLLPAGFDFDPPVLANLLGGKPGLADDELLLFDELANSEKIPMSCFVAANRSTVRLITQK